MSDFEPWSVTNALILPSVEPVKDESYLTTVLKAVPSLRVYVESIVTSPDSPVRVTAFLYTLDTVDGKVVVHRTPSRILFCPTVAEIPLLIAPLLVLETGNATAAELTIGEFILINKGKVKDKPQDAPIPVPQ